MSLTNFFKRFSSFFGKNKAKKIAEKAVNEAQYTKDIEHAKQILMRALEENPELLESVLSEFGKKINESENTPNKLLDKVAVEITESDVIPNSVLKAEGVIENMTDEGKKQLIDNNAIALKAQHAVMSQIEDPGLKKEATKIIEKRKEKRKVEKEKSVIVALSSIYRNCDELKELVLVDKIKELEPNIDNAQIKEIIENIVAKKMAYNYLKYRGTNILTLARLIPVNEMFSENLPEKVQNEWNKIFEKNKYNDSEIKYYYSKEALKEQLLEYIAKFAKETYAEIGRFNIPPSKQMQSLSPEEEEKFIKLLGPMSKVDKLDVYAQIRGTIGIREKIKGLEEHLLEIKEEERNRQIQIIELMKLNKSMAETIETMQKYEIFEKLENISAEDRKKAIESFASALKIREEKKLNFDKRESTIQHIKSTEEEYR